MLYLINLLLIGVVLVLALMMFAWREAQKYGTGTREELTGICASSIQTASQKERRKQAILTLLTEQSELSNTEVRRALGVSSRTAVRYLNELEEKGLVVQVGKTGHAVTYRLT